MSEQFRRDNHFLPSLYLRGFADPSGQLFAYRVLVSTAKVPLWKPSSPKGAGYLAHLYTTVLGGKETDGFERWLNSDFECPAGQPLSKALADLPLASKDWRILARFAAAQVVRTPAFFLRFRLKWEKDVPVLLKTVLTEMLDEMRDRKEQGESAPVATASEADLLPVKVTLEPAIDPKFVSLSATTIAGRDMWLFAMRQLLTNTIVRLEDHRWTILHPYADKTWFTTDDPVVCLNYYSSGSYDFGGGWGRPGSEIFMALGPKHLLYTRVGSQPPRRGTVLDRARTELIRGMIAEHAHRTIFSSFEDEEIPQIRPRRVDPAAFERERRFWKNWHSEQTSLLEQLKQG